MNHNPMNNLVCALFDMNLSLLLLRILLEGRIGLDKGYGYFRHNFPRG
jgi:hypothetical protein